MKHRILLLIIFLNVAYVSCEKLQEGSIYIVGQFSSNPQKFELANNLFDPSLDNYANEHFHFPRLRDEIFKRTGLLLKTPEPGQESLTDANYVIVLNGNYNKYNLHMLSKEKLILLITECPAVLAISWNGAYQDHFNKIFTWNDDLVDSKKFFKYNRAVLSPMIKNTVDFDDKKLCTMMLNNKCPKANPKQLCTERHGIINFFESIQAKDFDFYGRGWDRKRYKNYKGSVGGPENQYRGSKIETIKNYKFYICYENMRDIKGYITEKIFDCFEAGCVPIYFGAPNVETYIPKNCFEFGVGRKTGIYYSG